MVPFCIANIATATGSMRMERVRWWMGEKKQQQKIPQLLNGQRVNVTGLILVTGLIEIDHLGEQLPSRPH